MIGWLRHAKVSEERLRSESPQVTADPQLVETKDGNVVTERAKPLAIRNLLENLSLFIAPPTLVVALAFWFGWKLTNTRSDYFGIDSSTLGFSTSDYLLRSADAIFVPIAITLLLILLATIIHGLMRHASTKGRYGKGVRYGAAIGFALGATLAFFGVWSMFKPLPITNNYLVPPVILGLGPSLMAYTAWTLRHARASNYKITDRAVPSWERSAYVIAAMLALLGIFWAFSLYAAALGLGRAETLAANLSSRPEVTVFSVKSLGINAVGVTASKITMADSAYKFRYSGLRLLVYSGNKYFLVNDEWSHGHGIAIVLHDTSDIRLEFTPGG